MTDKPSNQKAQLYACIFPPLQQIARDLGYNLIIHGSLGRDCDLVAIPWIDNPCTELELIQAIHRFFTGNKCYEFKEQYQHSYLPGGRSNYIIILTSGKVDFYGIWRNSENCEWYLDINITPLVKAK